MCECCNVLVRYMSRQCILPCVLGILSFVILRVLGMGSVSLCTFDTILLKPLLLRGRVFPIRVTGARARARPDRNNGHSELFQNYSNTLDKI